MVLSKAIHLGVRVYRFPRQESRLKRATTTTDFLDTHLPRSYLSASQSATPRRSSTLHFKSFANMAIGAPGGLSKRAWANVEDIMPKIAAAVQERVKVDNPSIDLSTAENWLIRDEVVAMCKEAVVERLSAQDLSYPRAFAGFPEALAAFASFFNTYFNPHIPVEISHLATAPGAASCVDTLLYNICDPGEGVLVPGPYWSTFDTVASFELAWKLTNLPVQVATTFNSRHDLPLFPSPPRRATSRTPSPNTFFLRLRRHTTMQQLQLEVSFSRTPTTPLHNAIRAR